MSIKLITPKERLQKLKDTITLYKNSSRKDTIIIDNIKKELFDNKRKEILKNFKNSIDNNFNTIHDHQRFTNIAINPFIKIQGETVVPNHELIMIDPFVSLKDLPLKKSFDVLILNKERNYNTLIFLETKTSKFSEKLLNQIIDKIQYYESMHMQNFIREELKSLKINRIEYVLLIQPHRNDKARKLLIDKEIERIDKDGNIESIKIPLIIWNLHPSNTKTNYYYLMIQPYNDNTNEAIKLRQYHQNQNLVKFLSQNMEYILFTSLISLKFSPVLDFTYQFIMSTIELLKLYDSQTFSEKDLKELINEQLFSNLQIEENIDYVYQKILKKGLGSKIFAETKEKGIYKIRMRRSKQPNRIQKEIINRISSYKTERKFNSTKIQLDLYKKLLDIFLINPNRKFKTILDKY